MQNTISRRSFVRLGAASAAGLGAATVLAGCGGGAKTDDSVIKVGLMGPYSGDVAQYGLAVRNGAQLYVKQINDKGGINGKKVELTVQDEKGDATEAVNVYNKMVEEGVVAIIGDVTSTPSTCARALYARRTPTPTRPLRSARAARRSGRARWRSHRRRPA
jgi:branched-chain amino acid transport system substrate-binding protein